MDNKYIGFALLIIIILIAVFHENIIAYFEYCLWKRKNSNIHEYDDSIIQQVLMSISEDSFSFYGNNIPYGRSRWFVAGNEEFNKNDIDTLEYYGFSPIRSQEELDFHEYGILLTQNGIYASWQLADTSQKGKYKTVSRYCPFEGLWKVVYNKEKTQIKLYYKAGRIKKFTMNGNEEHVDVLVRGLNALIDTGYTYDLHTGYIKEKINAAVAHAREYYVTDEMMAAKVGALGAIYANLPLHFKGELLNSIINNPQGHGFAAEYANNIVDQVRHPFLEVRRIGQDNAKNGADRIVGDTRIQTKYLSSARNSVNAAFEPKKDGGLYRYEGMQLEVPKDQYLEAIEVMKQRIAEGKVPGVTNPEDAKYIIRKGSVTWKEAKLIAEGGNIVSLKYDALDGVVNTLPTASVCFVIMFAQAKWSGASTKDAAIVAAKAGVTTLCIGTIVYAGSHQFAKMFAQQIAERTGKKIMADSVAKNASLAISFGIVLVPNLFDTLRGRISSQQLLKNTVVAGGGFAAGVLSSAGAGAALGSVAPGAGTVVGAVVGATAGIVGGIAGATIAKKIMDQFIEDDRKEMFAQLKEEYLDVIMSISLSENEFEAAQGFIFDKSLENKLKSMYHAGKKGNSRIYAREKIVEYAIETVIKEREQIQEIELMEGVDYLVATMV